MGLAKRRPAHSPWETTQNLEITLPLLPFAQANSRVTEAEQGLALLGNWIRTW